MSEIRKHASVHDIIVGMAGSGKQGLGRYYPRLIYWMRVEEALSFDEYWHDPRFVNKKPQIPGPKIKMVGDRTYRHEPPQTDWSFETSMHYIAAAGQSEDGHVFRDTKVDRILISRCFTYWGNSGPELPAHLVSLFPNPRGQKCRHDSQRLFELHQFIGVDKPQSVVGDPADWDNPRYFTD
jgi:hypothetical protein